MLNKTGFYRVTKDANNGKSKWKYQVHNKLMKIYLSDSNLLKLKIKVLDAHLDWGITDLEQAKKTCKKYKYDIKLLQGEYGQKTEGD